MRRTSRTLALLVVLAAALTGCVEMPVSGPVVQRPEQADHTETPGVYFDPLPPQPGQSEAEIVAGFLEAMKASPIRTTVARQFLSEDARDVWAPEEEILTYAELGDPLGTGVLGVTLSEVNSYDERGAWSGSRPAQTMNFRLVREDDEWRIDEAPDALVVPDSWFNDWYRRVSSYRFDPTGEILVPEPVHVPEGDQFASALVRGLLPAPEESEEVTRTYFPRGLNLLSVPIDSAGVADVSLSGSAGDLDELTQQRMLVQLIWTLRQEPRIRAVRLSVDGEEIGRRGGVTQVNLDVGGAFDPNGAYATGDLFGLKGGKLVRGPLSALTETPGPLGVADLGVRSMAVSVEGTRVAAVSGGGGSLLSAPVMDEGRAEEVLSGAEDLGTPAWDHAGRVWVVDRRRDGARVLSVHDGRVREVVVPRISGARVEHLLVSRDGTRLVATVAGRTGDRVLAARLRYAANGRLREVLPAVELNAGEATGRRVVDLAWRTPTTVLLAVRVGPDLSELRTLSVDGSPAPVDLSGASQLGGRVRGLVSSPMEGAEVYALVGGAITDVRVPQRTLAALPEGLTSLRYAG